MKKINGKQVKITKAGYVYVDDKKISLRKATPLNLKDILPLVDKKTGEYISNHINNNYTLC